MWTKLRTTGTKVIPGLLHMVGKAAHCTRIADLGASEG